MKKLLCIALALLMILPIFAACRPDEDPVPVEPADVEPTPMDVEPTEQPGDGDDDDDVNDIVIFEGFENEWKIGIITGTVSQGEEEFMAGQKMLERHGADRIITATYPDQFSQEIETTIAQTVGLVDAGVDAIVFCQAVVGSLPALQRAREINPDLLIIVGTIAEPTREIAAVADIVLQTDDIGRGVTIMEQAYKLGATTFVHYSFPRHLAVEMIARRRYLLIEAAERLGIEFVDVMAPDPSEGGLPATQQFIIEDVPRQVEVLGPDTAFFATNCGMQEPMIRQVVELGAIYAEPCCPSPFHAMPAAFNIEYEPGGAGLHWMIEQISEAVYAAGMAGRISNWEVPVNMLIIEAGVKYAIMYLEGQTNGRMDTAAVHAALQYVLDEYDTSLLSIANFEDDEGVLDNMFMIIGGLVNFGT